MSPQGHTLVVIERRSNPYTTGQAAAGPKASLHTGTAEELPLYTQVT